MQTQTLEHEFGSSLDQVTNLCNGLASKLISSLITDDRETSNESQILLSLIVNDLVTIIEHNIVEYPIAILIIKSIILQCISYLQIDPSKTEDLGPKIELNHKLQLIDILKEIMIPI